MILIGAQISGPGLFDKPSGFDPAAAVAEIDPFDETQGDAERDGIPEDITDFGVPDRGAGSGDAGFSGMYSGSGYTRSKEPAGATSKFTDQVEQEKWARFLSDVRNVVNYIYQNGYETIATGINSVLTDPNLFTTSQDPNNKLYGYGMLNALVADLIAYIVPHDKLVAQVRDGYSTTSEVLLVWKIWKAMAEDIDVFTDCSNARQDTPTREGLTEEDKADLTKYLGKLWNAVKDRALNQATLIANMKEAINFYNTFGNNKKKRIGGAIATIIMLYEEAILCTANGANALLQMLQQTWGGNKLNQELAEWKKLASEKVEDKSRFVYYDSGRQVGFPVELPGMVIKSVKAFVQAFNTLNIFNTIVAANGINVAQLDIFAQFCRDKGNLSHKRLYLLINRVMSYSIPNTPAPPLPGPDFPPSGPGLGADGRGQRTLFRQRSMDSAGYAGGILRVQGQKLKQD